MLNDKALFTPTMAKVLEGQGYLREAGQIYAHLLEQMPGHQAFREKAEEIRHRLDKEAADGDRLPALFDEWLTLASEYRRLEQLKEMGRFGKRSVEEER
jgi:hypothetical protein